MGRSRGGWTLHDEMHLLAEAIINSFDGNVHIGNLNYDTLLLSAPKAVRPVVTYGPRLQPILNNGKRRRFTR